MSVTRTKMLTCHKPFCKETLVSLGMENKTTAGHSGSGKDPRVTARK